MALETVNNIADLVITNPTNLDPKSEGDDHIRNIKKALKTDLPNITGPITATQAELNVLDGITASTAELNLLDGVTATTAEINHIDGVTSPIQTQLDAKAPLASPALTGTPTAPTAAANTNTTQIATTAHVFAERTNTATLTNKTLNAPVINSPTGIVKGDVGLGNVDNTSDLNKPISTATQTALNNKQPLDADLTAIAAITSTGMLARTGSGTASVRTLTAGAGITITNGDGVSGNPTIAVDSGGLPASASSALISYLPAGTGAVATTVQSKLREWVSVKDFGAVGDGVVDDTAAIQAAIDSLPSQSVPRFSLDGGAGRDSNLNIGLVKGIYFPRGHYLVSAEISFPSGITIIGDNAYVRSESTTLAIFRITPVKTQISGFVFDGGKYHIHCWSTDRTEASWVHIENCDFRHAQTRCIYVDRSKITSVPNSPGYPMTLQINNCRSYGCPFLEAYTNGTFVDECWIAWDVVADDHDDLPLFVANDKLNLRNILEAPFRSGGGVNTNRTPRIASPGGKPGGGEDPLFCTIESCRWGGEATFTPLAKLQDKFSALTVYNSAMFGFAEGYWLEIDKMPELVVVQNCLGGATTGFTNTWGIWVNSANITSPSDLTNFCRFDLDTRSVALNARKFTYSTDRLVNGGGAFNLLATQNQNPSKDVIDAVATNLVPGDGITFWAAPYVITNKNNVGGYGGTESVLGYNLGYVTSSANNFYIEFRVGGFTAPAAGIYTFSCLIKVQGRCTAAFRNDNTSNVYDQEVELHPGVNFFSARFYHDGVTSTNPGVYITGPNSGNRLVVGLFAIHEGTVAYRWQSPNSSAVPMLSRHFYATAAPTTGVWRRGDIVWNTTPSAAGIPGWICTTAGTPGTWKAMAVLAA